MQNGATLSIERTLRCAVALLGDRILGPEFAKKAGSSFKSLYAKMTHVSCRALSK